MEKFILILSLSIIIALEIFLVTPLSDNYWQYNTAKAIINNPSFLWSDNLTGMPRILADTSIFQYPPLLGMVYASTIMMGLGPKLIDIISIMIILLLLFKMEKKAVPVILLSFIFIRIAVQGGIDIFLLSITIASLYFFEKKPIVSAVLAGLAPLVKGTGFLFLGAWMIALIFVNRKNILNKKIIQLFAILIIPFLILSPWYLRNFFMFNGDIPSTVLGFTLDKAISDTAELDIGVQANQPERYAWDTSGFYPLPIDLMFYLGILFTIFNIYKTKKTGAEHIFIGIFVISYFVFQILNLKMIMIIRYYLPVFPLLAIQISKGVLNDKYVKILYAFCILAFLCWIALMPKYSFNEYESSIAPFCTDIKEFVGNDTVYVDAFHNWYTIYKCNLNATSQVESKWTLDLYNNQLYLTNNSNSSIK